MEVNEISIFWPKNPMNDTSQFREDIREIYILKNLLTWVGLNYVETFLDCFWMTEIFLDFCPIHTPL